MKLRRMAESQRTSSAVERVIALENWLIDCWRDDVLCDWRVADLPVWPIVAHALNSVVLLDTLLDQKPHVATHRGHIGLIGDQLRRSVRRFGRRVGSPAPFWQDGDVVMFATVSARQPHNGLCRTTDALRLRAWQHHQQHWILLYTDLSSANGDSAGTIAGPVRGIANHLATLRGLAKHGSHHQSLAGFDAFVRKFAALSGFPSSALTLWVDRILDHFQSYVDSFRSMIATARPHAIVLTDHGDAFSGAICAAAREAEVPVWCIQHGVLRRADPEHPLHPSRALNFATFPDRHLVWRTGSLGPCDSSIGPPSLLLALADHPSLEELALSSQAPIETEVPTVLIAPQTPSALERLVGTLELLRDCHLLWRPHPRFAAQSAANAHALRVLSTNGRCTVEQDHAPIAASLLRSDRVITEYSAVALEAAALGIETVCLSEYAAWSFAGQFSDEFVSFDHTAIGAPITISRDDRAKVRAGAFRAKFAPLRDNIVADISARKPDL